MPKTSRQNLRRTQRVRPPKTYRFDARLTEEQKTRIQRAADIEGRSMTDFVLRSAKEAAERTIEREGMLVLTARDTEVFVDRLLRPPKAGPALRKALRKYRQLINPSDADI